MSEPLRAALQELPPPTRKGAGGKAPLEGRQGARPMSAVLRKHARVLQRLPAAPVTRRGDRSKESPVVTAILKALALKGMWAWRANSVTLTGFVYFAAPSVGVHAVKIGWSTNPWAAVREGGNRWTWFGLEVLATIRCHGDPFAGTNRGSLERTLHDFFAGARIKREWFQPCDTLLELIGWAAARTGSGAVLWAHEAAEWVREREAA